MMKYYSKSMNKQNKQQDLTMKGFLSWYRICNDLSHDTCHWRLIYEIPTDCYIHWPVYDFSLF